MNFSNGSSIDETKVSSTGASITVTFSDNGKN